MNNSNQNQEAFSHSREGTVTPFLPFLAIKNRNSVSENSSLNPITMEKMYNSTGVSSPTRTEQCLSLPKGVEVRVYREMSKGSSFSLFKSFALTLAMLVVGIGSLWGQVALITASNGGFEAATSTAAANGWTAVGTSARTWRVGTLGGAATGTKAAYWGTATAFGGSAASAVGHFYRDIAIPAGATNVFLNYKLKYPTIDANWDYFYVFTTTTANTPVNAVIPSAGYTNRFTNTATAYAAFTAMPQVDLTALAGTTVRLVFTFKTDAATPNAAPAVDDITLTYIASAGCSGTPAPGNTISSLATVATGGTVNLSLQNATSGSGVTYAWESGSSSTGPWTVFGTSAATQTSPAINANTWFRCRVICGANTGASNPVQVTLAYCSPSSTSVDGSGITNVSFGSSPAVNNTTTTETNNYGNYSAQIGGFFQGANASVSITLNTFDGASSYDYNTIVFVDWNNDLDFADAGETVWTGLSAVASPTVVTASFTVSSLQAPGNYRMRIGAGDAAAPGACTTGTTWTCFEDYTINVQAIPLATCPTLTAPANAATGVSLTPTLTWTAGSNTSSYDVYLSTNQTDVNNESAIARVSTAQAGTSYTSAALTPSATYYWRIVPKNSFGTAATGCTTRSFTTTAPTPTISQSGTLSAFSACQNVASAQQSFSVSGLYLSGDLVVTAPTGFSVSTTSGSGWASSVSLTPAGGTVSSTLIYARMNALASNPTSGNIVCSSTSASSVNVTVSGSLIAAPTVNAGSDFNLCSGQTVALSGSTNATSVSGSVSATYSAGNGNSLYDFAPATTTNSSCPIPLSVSIPAGAVITGVNVSYNMTAASGAYMSEQQTYLKCTNAGGSSEAVMSAGAGNLEGTMPYNRSNLTIANGVSGGGTINFQLHAFRTWGGAGCEAVYSYVNNNTFTVTVNYTINPTYSWSPATGLSATNVLNPNCSTTATTTYTLTVTGTNGCSASDQVVATVAGGAVPTTPTAAVSGASTVNVGGTAILTSTAGANTVWYTTATGGTAIGSGSPFTSTIQCASGSATYYAEDNNGTCASNARGAVSFTVRPMLASNPANALICQAGGSVTLSTQLTGGTGITWSPNTNLSTTSGTSTIASPTATTIYTMTATVAGCGSVSGTQTVGVIDAVAFTPTSTPASVCAGNTAALASNLASAGFTYATTTFGMASPSSPTNLASGGVASTPLASGNLDDGGWQNIPIGFTYNFFGNNYTTLNVGTNGVIQFGAYNATSLGDFTYATAFPTVTEPTNVIAAAANDFYATVSGTIRYWTQGIAPTRIFVAEWNAVPGWTTNGSMTVQVKLFETTGNVEIHVQNASSSNNKVVGLQNADASIGATAYSNTAAITTTAWKFIPGANYTFQWATAGADILTATATTYTTPALNTPGTVTYSVAATNPNTQCTTTQSVNVTVNALPSAPNSSGDVTACSTLGNQTLAVTTGAGETADWFAASTGGTVLASGDNVLSYSTATAGTYYAAAQNTTTGCSSASRTGVTLNVNTSPAAPTVTTPVAYCQGAPATTLTATETGANTLNWYSAAPSYPAVTGATALGSAPTPSTSTAGTTNYYVSQSSSANSCESQLALVAVTVNATPSTPVASNPAAYCQGATASALTATATAGNTLYWYTVPTGGTGSATAPTPSTATSGTTDYYVADRTDASGCEGSRTTVTVTVNPTITASVSNSASSTSACGGGAITFTATPTNGGTPAYQWYLNGAAVSGETNATYTLATPNNADAIYVEMTPSAQTCLASSAATASNTVPLTSTAATPTVAIQSSASTAFCPGTSVTFSVNASANMGASPTYQWNLNSTPISGETNATLVNTTLSNNDQVTLTMTSSLGGACLTQSDATSSAITSTVNSATVISTQPAAAAACLGGSTSFTASATGTGTLTYQWKKTGSNVTGNASATTSTLTLSGIAAGDAANYTVDVTGTCGTVSSTAAALSINSATAISAQPSAVIQCAGTTANFSVTGSGQGTLTYQWRKDGSALTGETNSTLAVANIATLNAGQYSVIVSGGCGNVPSSNALLTVNSGTSISTQPAASTLCAGNTVNFSVTASGTGALSYQWKKDGTNVGTNSSSLSIANTQAANAGTYTVEVSSSCGSLISNNTLLTVNPLTTISTQPVGTAGCEGQNTTFTVVAAGSGTLSYQWKYGATNVGTNSSSYNIPSTSNANDGNYSVVVTGTCGNATSNTVALNVYNSPTIAASITTSDFTSTAMCGVNQVSITAASIGNDSQAEWTVVGSSSIVVDDPMSTTITATAANSALGGSVKKLVWEVSRETSGNFCYSRDTISIDFKQPVITPISGVVATGDLLWGGLTNTTWGTSTNWYELQNDGTASAWIKLATGQPGASSKTYTLANSVAGSCVSALNAPALATAGSTSSVYIGTGANLNLNAGNLTIEGNLVNNGTITPGNGTVTFTGSSAQTISGTGTVSDFNNLLVNKASGTLTLSQPARVTGTLTMTQGDIVSDATNILEIGTSASSVGSVSWASGTVRGPMKRWFATSTNSTQASGVFPVGANVPGKGVINRYAQVNFTSAPGAGGYVIAEYKTGTPSTGYTGLPLTYNSNQYIQNYEEEGYWDITPYNTEGTAYAALNTAPYTLKLRMNNPSTLQPGFPPSGSNGNVIADISKLRIITSKGPSHNTWILAGTQGSGHVVLGTGDYLLEETGVTGFSFFNGGGNDNNPLPVELLNFNGTCEEGMVNLVWQTASEFNSSHFDLEKSTDGETWRVLATIPSAGISNELLTYQTVDNNGTNGSNYYRLRQVDIDGKEKLYDPINVSCAETTVGYFTSYPNPSGNEFQVIVNNIEILGACTLNIVDAQGKVIDQRSIEVKDGINMFVISETLNPGFYFLNITNGTKTTQVIKHAVK
ncbi:MAG: T9SS type A sorting domain-containing protein [Crocinitomicaceae bacterium]|nr:T9SS type A sorting domain-containing protein [Crocinitomicaceae bacterium]